MIYIFAIAVLLSAIVMAVMEKHFITLGIFAALWGILSLIEHLSGNDFGVGITFGVGVVFIILETIRRKLYMVNLKM
jgi:multisubunit Na+/H+ antiporter MnhE subunit